MHRGGGSKWSVCEHDCSVPAPALALDLIIANSIHDMKNSVGILLGGIDELRGDAAGVDHALQARLGGLGYEARRMAQRLSQLLTLYRMSDHGYGVNVAEHEVLECAEEWCEELAEAGAMSSLDVSLDCDADLFWYFDRDLVGSVIGGLLNNAYKYGRSRVLLSIDIHESCLRLRVCDDGPGFPDRLLFDSRFDDDLERRSVVDSTGTGLGFYFAARIAACHRRGERCGHVVTANDGIAEGGAVTVYIP